MSVTLLNSDTTRIFRVLLFSDGRNGGLAVTTQVPKTVSYDLAIPALLDPEHNRSQAGI